MVEDISESIIVGFYMVLEGVDVVLMIGGLGFIKDDIIKKIIVDFFGVGMYFDEFFYNWL